MENKITFINHATVLIQLHGMSFLTDPVYTKTVSYILPRFKPPGVPFEQLPSIDCILISHNHYDHLNFKTLRRLREKRQSTIILPKRNGKYARRLGFEHIVELDWWETYELHGVKITCVPAKHTSGRGVFDMNRALFAGYVLEADGKCVYFAGDSAYDQFFRYFSSRFSIDVALLPIGAYRPRSWFKHIHMSPEEAVKAFLDMNAKYLIPIHWGTFKISDEPMSEPPMLLRKEVERLKISKSVYILNNGECFSFSNE